MDQVYLLWFLSISMLIGSFLSGLVPMAFRLSDSKSRLLALLGSGILVGTALAIIIPEGIDSLYGQSNQFLPSLNHNQSPSPSSIPKENIDHESGSTNSPNRDEAASTQTWTIGISLIVGFILMLLIDQFSILQSQGGLQYIEHDISHSRMNYTLTSQDENEVDTASEEQDNRPPDLTDSDTKPIKEADVHRVVMQPSDSASSANYTGIRVHTNHSGPNTYYDHSKFNLNRASGITKVTPTLGLVIHAAADGVALGAAATTSHRQVEMIIFLAIMLHKAPAAFSLVVLLLHKGLKHSTIRKHLMAFSLSAPIAAIVTYYGLSQSGKEALRQNNATGIAMLFSAGTFLFVATVHVLPDLVHNKLLSPKELFCLVGGAFLPLLLAQTI